MVFHKILVANRGEIAVRVIRTAQAMGYRTVAVYSEADAYTPHVELADEAVCIGAGPVAASYLDGNRILLAAQESGADALHPGYGFLSENGEFAEACERAGIAFIGPSSQAITLMGSKRLSKIAMQKAQVPCIPGYEGEEQGDERMLHEARAIGFPLMVKASAGGGGRGMRLVLSEDGLLDSLQTARSEAKAAFGSGELILEKAVTKPRHIEIQIFADEHGNVVHLGERDCSIQRRHQKVVEEAPSPFVDETLRAQMGQAAVAAAQSCQYRGAGTVEFLVDEDKHFYFLEMNTRLQVEHPVTELVTGLDLVAWQLTVAAGEPLPLTQAQVQLKGHAIEVRLYAEDPRNQFMPQTGTVLRWQKAQGEGVRIDSGIQTGQEVSAFYDPMLAKIVAYGGDREEARRRLIRAVEDTLLLGVTSNKRFLADVLKSPAFAAGSATTAFLQTDFDGDQSLIEQKLNMESLGLAGVLLYRKGYAEPDGQSWTNGTSLVSHFLLQHSNDSVPVTLIKQSRTSLPRYEVSSGEESVAIDVIEQSDDEITYRVGALRKTARYCLENSALYLDFQADNFVFEDISHRATQTQEERKGGSITASMDGSIVSISVKEGDPVTKGQTLVVLEAMKMEHQLKAGADGTVKKVTVAVGDQVKNRQLLVDVDRLV